MNPECMRVALFEAPSVSLRLAVRRCQTVLLRMVLEWSFEIVSSDEEPAQSYAPPSTSGSAFASPDGFLLVFFSNVAAEISGFCCFQSRDRMLVSVAEFFASEVHAE